MDENHSREFVNCLAGLYAAYHKSAEKELSVYWNLRSNLWWKDLAPSYFGKHLAKVSLWNYANDVALLDAESGLREQISFSQTRSLDLRELPPHIVNDERNLAPNNQNSGFFFNANDASVGYRNWTVVRADEGELLMNGELNKEQNGELRKGSPESSDTSSAYCSESNFICSPTNGLLDNEFTRNEFPSGKKVSFMDAEPNDLLSSPDRSSYTFNQQRADLPHSFFSPHYNIVRYNRPGKLKINEGTYFKMLKLMMFELIERFLSN